MKRITHTIIQAIIYPLCFTLLALFCLWLYRANKPNIDANSAEYHRINEAIKKARKVEREVFCEEYRKIVLPQNAPFAYKNCFDEPSNN